MSHPLNADSIQQQVVAMYERHPFPAYSDKFRKTAEEMDLKMRLLGVPQSDYHGRKILDAGCGTGEFTCWYAARGNEVTAIDLSRPSLEHAKAYAAKYHLDDRIDFQQQSVLDLNLPNETFDFVYCYGVLHHTPDPHRGFRELVRVCKPGGVVVVSVYNRYSRFMHRLRQKLIARMAGDDVERRCRLGKRLFPRTARRIKKRAHDASDAVLYDQFSQPHESAHTVGEVLGWMDLSGLSYTGAFGPLRLRDHLYAACLPEFREFEKIFDGYPGARMAAALLRSAARLAGMRATEDRTLSRPGAVSRFLVQMGWFFLGLRFSCFSIAGRKPIEAD
jgi:2-polyprenyl-3-methyl-5-hydroxy-6-metoxy-1,4-benzoquinol methylase